MKLQKTKASFIREDKRGIFVEALNGNVWKNVSFGKMAKGAVMGNHYHKKTNVFFFIIKGLARIDNIDVRKRESSTVLLREREGVIFPPYNSHAIFFKKNSFFVMGKSKKYHPKNTDTYEYVVNIDK